MGKKLDTTILDGLIINYLCSEIVKKRGCMVTNFTKIAIGIGYKWKFGEIRERIVTLGLFKITHVGTTGDKFNYLQVRINTKGNRELYKLVDHHCIEETEWKDINIEDFGITPREYSTVAYQVKDIPEKYAVLLEKLEKAEYQTKKVKEMMYKREE